MRDPKGIPGEGKGSSKPWRMSGVREAGAMGAGLRPRCESDTLPGRDYRAGVFTATGKELGDKRRDPHLLFLGQTVLVL